MIQPRSFSQRSPIIETVFVAEKRRGDQPVEIVLDGNAHESNARVSCAADSPIPSPQIRSVHCDLSSLDNVSRQVRQQRRSRGANGPGSGNPSWIWSAVKRVVGSKSAGSVSQAGRASTMPSDKIFNCARESSGIFMVRSAIHAITL